MKNDQWLTPEAKEALDSWLQHHQTTWASQGADPEEIRSDLEAHLYRERDGGEIIGVERVEAAIDSMGLPSMGVKFSGLVQETPAPKEGCLKSISSWFIGMISNVRFLAIWSAAVLVWEFTTGTLAGMFFDPIARNEQVIVLGVVVGFGLVAMLPRFQKNAPDWMVFLRGAAAAVSGYWAVFLLPVLVFGTLGYGMAVIYSFGIGLLFFPVYFLCALTAAAPMCAMFGFLKPEGYRAFGRTGFLGMLLGIVILVCVEGPSYVTRHGVAQNDPALIRNMGSEKTLLAMCLEGGTRFDTTGFISGIGQGRMTGGGFTRFTRGEEIEKRRKIYYQVTGEGFNEVSREKLDRARPRGPSSRRSRGGFDADLGGDAVAGPIDGLELAGSRLDAHVDAASRLGYFEWTMDFSNNTLSDQEARMQVLLPKNAVVSRLTLWVNGEPQEAAFSSKEKVTEAYRSIAVVERRDPVLVRWVGTDRVMVQCFPVLTTENMKIRIGVTAPLDDEGRLFVPRLIEKNFDVPENLQTTVWLQGDTEMSLPGLTAKGELGKWRETHGGILARDLMARHSQINCKLPQPQKVVWTRDQFASEAERYLVRKRLENEVEPRSQKIVFVVDGSSYFSKWTKAADEAIGCLQNRGHEVVVILANSEKVIETGKPLADYAHLGGQNCIPALRLGLSKAQEMKADHLIWMHGSQPISFGDEEGFLQLLERGFFEVAFSTVDLEGKPNRLVETVSKRVEMAGSARPTDQEDLMSALHRLLLETDSNFQWERQAVEPTEGKEVWDHLARHRVWEQVQEMSRTGKRKGELTKLAAEYQLVTQVSGAVVLETAEQYKRFGLEQVEVETTPEIPGVPEPSTALFSLLSVVMVWRRKRIYS